jgi:hypothetical protein
MVKIVNINSLSKVKTFTCTKYVLAVLHTLLFSPAPFLCPVLPCRRVDFFTGIYYLDIREQRLPLELRLESKRLQPIDLNRSRNCIALEENLA